MVRSAVERKNGAAADPMSGEAMYRDIVEYAALGQHRTATAPDVATSLWLAQRLQSYGLTTRFEPFTVRQFFVEETELSIKGNSVPCFPLWFPSAAPTVQGPLLTARDGANLKGAVALVRLAANNHGAVSDAHEEVLAKAVQAGASAVVGIIESPTGELVAQNTNPPRVPWRLPVLLVGERDARTLLDPWVDKGVEVSLRLQGEDRRKAAARNVIGDLKRGPRLVLVSTPHSGWFQCGSGRGAGIGLLLGLARWAAARPSGCSYRFVTTAGHELGALGMTAHLAGSLPPQKDVVCWLHLGVGVAAWDWEESPKGLRRLGSADPNRFLMTTPEVAPHVAPYFAGHKGLEQPQTNFILGEQRLIAERGYTTLGIVGRSRYHHTWADNPEMTAPELLEPVGRALARSLEALETRASVGKTRPEGRPKMPSNKKKAAPRRTVVLVQGPKNDYLAALVRAVAPKVDLRFAPDAASLSREIAEADGYFGRITPPLLSAAQRLRWIHSPLIGLESTMFPALVTHPAVITMPRGVFNEDIADHVMAFVLCFARGFHRHIQRQTKHYWAPPPEHRVLHLPDLTMGIVGFGGIGAGVATRAAAAGMRVLAVDPKVQRKPKGVESLWKSRDLPKLLKQSDFVAICAPETPETTGLFDEATIARMKKGSYLINVGRGPIVRLDPLTAALKSGHLAGAGLDVFEVEPLPADHPLWDMENVIISPHSAWLGRHVDERRVQIFADNVGRFARGKPLTGVADKAKGF